MGHIKKASRRAFLASVVGGSAYVATAATQLMSENAARKRKRRIVASDDWGPRFNMTASNPFQISIVSPPPPPGDVTFFWEDGFENATGGGTADIQNPFYNVAINGAGRVDLVADPAGSGSRVARCRVDRTGSKSSNYRAECIPVPGPNFPRWREEFWAGWALYFEPSWQSDPRYCIVDQFKERQATVAANPVGALEMNGMQMKMTLRHGTDANPQVATGLNGKSLGTLGVDFPFGWNFFIARITWDWNNSSGNGGMQLWRNDISLFDYHGPCGYDLVPTPNLRGGAYMSRQSDAASIIRTVYFDKIRQAHTSDGGSYAAVDPTQSGL